MVRPGELIALAVGLAFFFGYLLTSLLLLRSGMAPGAVILIAPRLGHRP